MLSTQTILQHFYDDDERVCRALDVYIYVGSYVIPAFGVRGNGARLAMVGRGRDVVNAKYSNWVRLRKPLEKLRPFSVTELLLSNDGDQILFRCLSRDSLRLLQHVETILVPSSWESIISKTQEEISWEEKQFKDVPGMITALIQKEIMERVILEGFPLCDAV